MNWTTILLGTLLLAAGLAPAAAADGDHEHDEHEFNPYTGEDDVDARHHDCETGQPAAGSDPETGAGGLSFGPVFVCEGEHWDGQDPIAPEHEDPNEIQLEPDPEHGDIVIAHSDGAGNEPPPSATDPLHLRLTAHDGGAYFHVAIFAVGETAVVADLEGTSVGWYGQDHTPLNVLATAISAAGITRGHVDDDDCDFATYETTREDRECGRDNTAITVELSP